MILNLRDDIFKTIKNQSIFFYDVSLIMLHKK